MLNMDSRQWVGTSYPWDSEGKAWTVKVVGDLTVMVTPFIYTAGIIVRNGEFDGWTWYTDRWCYHSVGPALQAAEAWDPEVDEEPTGWHRHPLSGRRREAGDPAKEYIAL